MNLSNLSEVHSDRSSVNPNSKPQTCLSRTIQSTGVNLPEKQQKAVSGKPADNNSRENGQARPLLEYIAQQKLEARMNNILTSCVEAFLLQFENLWVEIKSSIRSDFQSLEETMQNGQESGSSNPQIAEIELQYTRVAEKISELTTAFSGSLANEVKQGMSLKGAKKQAATEIEVKVNESNLARSLVSAESQKNNKSLSKQEEEAEDHSCKKNITGLFDAVANEPTGAHDESSLSKSGEPTAPASNRSSALKDSTSTLPRPGAKLLKEFPAIQNPKIQAALAQLGEFRIDSDDKTKSVSNKEESIKVYPPMVLENGDVYEGGWLLSAKQGYGKILSFSGFYYEGEWKNDLAHGKGRLINVNGDSYEGNWINGKYQGKGVFKGASGYSYKGEWSHDVQHGFGREEWADGSYYEGEYKWSKKHGRGTFKWANGESYTGQFCLNNLHGQGVYEWPDGKRFTGVWRENKIVGEVKFDSPNGKKDSNDKPATAEEENSKVVMKSSNCVMEQKENAQGEGRTSPLKKHSEGEGSATEVSSDNTANKENCQL